MQQLEAQELTCDIFFLPQVNSSMDQSAGAKQPSISIFAFELGLLEVVRLTSITLQGRKEGLKGLKLAVNAQPR